MNSDLVYVPDDLPECWVHVNDRYIYHVCIWDSDNVRHWELPCIDSGKEDILKELGISYRIKTMIFESILEYWDKSQYEELDLELPLYEYSLPMKAYRNLHKTYKGKHITKETIEAAWKFKPFVEKSIVEYRKNKVIEEAILNLLNDNVAVVLKLSDLDGIIYDEVSVNEREDFISENYRFKIVPVMTLFPKYARSSYYAIFDVNNIELNSIIKIYIPKGSKSIVIGKDAWQVKEWSKRFGLKKINVVEI